ERSPDAGEHTGCGGAGVAAGSADRQWLAGHRARVGAAPPHHGQGVHQPGHDPAVGVDVGGGYVAVRTEDGRDLRCVAPGEALELTGGEASRVATDAT